MTLLAEHDTLARVAPALTRLEVETPSWGYGNSGTRFKVFPQAGVPRNPFEKIEDAATVARYTGVARSIALHIPWDRVDDFSMLAAFARERGVRIGGSTRTRSRMRTTSSGRCATRRWRCARRQSRTSSSAARSPARQTRASSRCGWEMARTTPARTISAPAVAG